MREIRVTIAPDGTTKILTQGFAGVLCRDATREIERALGVVSDEKFTGEFYSSETNNNINVGA